MAGDFSEFSRTDFEAACILFSLSSSSSSTLTFTEWRKIQQSRALEQVITKFEYLQTVMGHTVEEALAMLKVEYKSNDKYIVNAIEGYEFLISHGHNRDEMLRILKAANGDIVKKKETEVQSKNRKKEKSSSLKAPMMMRMKGKKQKEGEKERVYKCKLCSMSFSTGQALGGHTTYHRKMIEVDAGEMELKPQFDFDRNDSQNDVDCKSVIARSRK